MSRSLTGVSRRTGFASNTTPVDTAFRNHNAPPNQTEGSWRRICPLCGRRHLVITACAVDPSYDPEARLRNGAYRGPCRVRVIPPGMSGVELAGGKQKRGWRGIARLGQIWMGPGGDRYRVVKVGPRFVTFQRIGDGVQHKLSLKTVGRSRAWWPTAGAA